MNLSISQLDFSGKNVLISGGSRGIGRATAILFAECGANVAFLYEQSDKDAVSTSDTISKLGRAAKVFKGSVSDESLWESATGWMTQTCGSIDVVIANAGIWNEALIDEMPLAAFEEMMLTNMTGTFLAAKYAAQHMKRQGAGAIVIISSTAGQRGESEHSHYAASKGAQISFTKSLSTELAPWNIRVNCVAPGWVKTDMTEEALTDPKTSEWVKSQIPLGRAADPKEIANAILFMASPLASFITGEILNVNGGAVLCG
jgi:3-oxoacyl-[acyl-carrier protein] reductase